MTPAVRRLIKLSRKKTEVLVLLGWKLGMDTRDVLRMVNNAKGAK